MAFVQYLTASGVSSTNSVSITATITTGNLVVLFVLIGNSSIQTVSSVTDSPVTNTYSFCTGSRTSNGVFSGTDIEAWYAQNVTGGTYTITAHWTTAAGTGYSQITLIEYSGVQTTGAFDVAAVAAGTSNTPAVTVNTTYWNDLIISQVQTAQSPTSHWANTGWGTIVDRTGGGNTSQALGDLTAPTNGSFVMGGTTSTSSALYIMSAASFKLASGAADYEWINAGTGVQLPVVGLTPADSAPGSPDASAQFNSPGMASTPVLSETPSTSINFTSPMGPSDGTPTLGEMPFGSILILNMFNGGFTGSQWLANVFILGQEYWDKTTTIYTGQLYPVPSTSTADQNAQGTLGQQYPTASKRRNYPF